MNWRKESDGEDTAEMSEKVYNSLEAMNSVRQGSLMPTKKKVATNSNITGQTFSAEEKAAMRERALELKANTSKEAAEKALLSKIAEMKGSDHTLAIRFHQLVTHYAPMLLPKTWYGMPAYANAAGKVVCYFQAAGKFQARYATIGFSDNAQLDAGNMWPTSFALITLTPTEEKMIIELLNKL